jgi:microcystin degradation protein MlrC
MASFRKDTQTFGPTGADVSVFQVPMIANKNGEVVTTTNPVPVTIQDGGNSITVLTWIEQR